MITVVDIQTNNAYSYGAENGFDRRVFIIYDGIHYDGEGGNTRMCFFFFRSHLFSSVHLRIHAA